MNAESPNKYWFPIDPVKPTIHAQWVKIAYFVIGIFPMEVERLSVEQISAKIPSLYATTKSHTKLRWPRGISVFFLFPVYIAESFDAAVIEWVHLQHLYRYAIEHEPFLYNKSDNAMHMRMDYGLRGSLYRPYLANVMGQAMHVIAGRFGHEFPQKLNGKEVKLQN